MKKIIITTLVLSLLLCFAGCGSETPGNDNTPAAGWSFSYNGTDIAMNADAAPIVTALGEPKTYTEETSCAFEGLDKTYFYGSFYLATYPVADQDFVYKLWFADDSISTAEGVYIGSTQAEAEAAYGADNFNGTNAYVVTKGGSKLTVVITDGAVSSIQYEAVVE